MCYLYFGPISFHFRRGKAVAQHIQTNLSTSIDLGEAGHRLVITDPLDPSANTRLSTRGSLRMLENSPVCFYPLL
jgi:hypothetical protein